MQKSPRYEVQTKYGWFSLDEGAYRDYLAGKLWITWPHEKLIIRDLIEDTPRNISKEVLELRDTANVYGVNDTVCMRFGNVAPAIPNLKRLEELGIEELCLSVRASNGLMRAGVNTFGKLTAAMNQEGGLFNIRNLGTKSEREIRMAYVEECYLRMLPYEKVEYWQSYLEQRVDAALER